MKLLQRLRATTAAHHEHLHDHPVLCQLTQDAITRAYHLQALRKFYGFYEPLERRYAAAGLGLLRDFPAGDIVMRLKNDLAHAGIDTRQLETLDEPQAPFTLEQAVAYLYLREGSNLGGKVISKNLHAQLSLEAGVSNQFFWGHGADAGRNWQHFLQTLSELENTLDIEYTANFAAQLFQRLDSWLSAEECSHAPTAS